MNIHKLQALLTFEETLAILKITRPTLYKIMNNNGIDVVRIGGRVLFTESAINEYIERCTVKNAVGGN
jgi:excisionase family DNA binding protein